MTALTTPQLIQKANTIEKQFDVNLHLENRPSDITCERIKTFRTCSNIKTLTPAHQNYCASTYIHNSLDYTDIVVIPVTHLVVSISICRWFIKVINSLSDVQLKFQYKIKLQKCIITFPAGLSRTDKTFYVHLTRLLYNSYGTRVLPMYLALSKRVNQLTTLQNLVYSFLLSRSSYSGDEFTLNTYVSRYNYQDNERYYFLLSAKKEVRRYKTEVLDGTPQMYSNVSYFERFAIDRYIASSSIVSATISMKDALTKVLSLHKKQLPKTFPKITKLS